MNIKFKDVQHGKVQARAVVDVADGIFINEITIIKKDRNIIVEFPQKSFRGKDNRMHYIDIISFENENKKMLWTMEIKEAYEEWRKKFRKIEVYESKAD